jgi:hypothetical protein
MAGKRRLYRHDKKWQNRYKGDTRLNALTKKTPIPPRTKVTHGIAFWLRTGKINPSIRGYKKIQKYLQDLEAQLIEESGGQAQLTAAPESPCPPRERREHIERRLDRPATSRWCALGPKFGHIQ